MKITSNDLDGKIKIESICDNQNYLIVIFDNQNEIYKTKLSKTLTFSITNPKLWSINNPYLYDYKIFDDTNKLIDSGHFGIRKISTNKKNICINDKPIFVKGYIRGATAHDHSNNLNCSESDFYRKNIKNAKAFGFNLVRFHSQIPCEEFLNAADELGLLVHIEMRPPHDLYNNLEEMINTRDDFIDKKFISDTINQLYNHPSFAVYCLGNEIRNLSNNRIVEEIANDIKSQDNTRLFIDTCAWGENNRPLVDIDVQHLSYYFPFGKHEGMYDDPNNLKVGDFNKGKDIVFNVPLLAHEVCHYTALRDFYSLGNKFDNNGIARPWWINEEIKMIESKGFKAIYNDMYKASKEFQLSCWKIAYEEMRSSKLLGGFHFLQFADTDVYENSNGVVDCFDDICYITPEKFLTFNGDSILYIKDIKYNYFCNQVITFPLFLSHFDESVYQNATVKCTFKSKSFLFERIISHIDVNSFGNIKLCDLNFNLPDVDEMEQSLLTVSFLSNDKEIAKNEYNLWIYPQSKSFNYDELVNFENDKISFTSDVGKAISLLKEDKNVCLIYRNDLTRHLLHKDMEMPLFALKATWNRYKPVIWDRGTNFGGLVNTNILGPYGYTKYYNHSFMNISEDCDKIILDGVLEKADNLILGIDKCNRDRFDAYKGSFNLPELMYDRTLRNFSYLFQIQVGKAKILVCGLNLLGINEHEPSACYFANLLIDYCCSDKFAPTNKISIEEFEKYTKNAAKSPVKERMMTQFWELDDAPVETKKYWEESRKYLNDNEKDS